jgi:hypothetical protein
MNTTLLANVLSRKELLRTRNLLERFLVETLADLIANEDSLMRMMISLENLPGNERELIPARRSINEAIAVPQRYILDFSEFTLWLLSVL